MNPALRLVFWETTKACNLTCKHCRAVPRRAVGPTELTTRRAFDLIDGIAEVAKPVMVLSGGEPLFRPDLYDICDYGVQSGFRMALATNGTLITGKVAAQIADAGFARVAVSLDSANPATHDTFRGMPGAHRDAVRGIFNLREHGVSVQINSTIAKHNVGEIDQILEMALGIGADALHLFMLVPVGCGLELAETEMLPADEYERVLHWFDKQSKTCPIDLKATCAPHYYRIRAQRLEDERRRGDFSGTFIAPGTRAKAAPMMFGDPSKRSGHPGGHPGGAGQHLSAMTRGCLAGTSVCFVSNEGEVFPCGYLPVSAGNTRVQRFADIWNHSRVFAELRDPEAYEGKCGECRYEAICGGCRARAYAATGSFLAEEPFCTYRPDLDPTVNNIEEARHASPIH
ncbi:MAG TPA: radical SAM protein [Vicinamibacterales bacterium]|nr:radical SAM protein [Vicinamibacterales bacterium]